MKNKVLISMLMGASLLTTTGCKESFLEPESLSEYTTDQVFGDVEGYNAVFANISNIIRSEYYGHMAPILAELVFSDVAVMGSEGANIPVNLETDIRPDGNLDKDLKIRSNWDNWWKIISQVNYVIDAVDANQNVDENTRKSLKGTAIFYRSYAYYRLAMQFGDVPFQLKGYNGPKLDFQSTSKATILAEIMKQMKENVANMPETSDWGTPNRAAGYHLLAKLCLANADFDGAIDACNKVINDGKHALMRERFGALKSVKTVGDSQFKSTVDYGYRALAVGPDVELDVIYDINHWANKSSSENKEAIYTVVDRYVSYDGTSDAAPEGNSNTNGGLATMRNYLPKWGDGGKILDPDGKSGMADNLNTGKTATNPTYGTSVTVDKQGNGSQYRQIGRGIGSLRASNLYNYDLWTDPNDVRHKQPNWWLMTDLVYNNTNSAYYGQNVRNGSLTDAAEGRDTIRIWYPFPDKFIQPFYAGGQQQGGHCDWYVFRVAETYLLRAEAYWWKGDIANATKDVNEVHTRAGASPLQTVDIDEIYNERARELHGEEPRKTELARVSMTFAITGKDYRGHTYTLDKISESSFMYDRIMEYNNFYKFNIRNKGADGQPGDAYTIRPYHIFWPIPYEVIENNTLAHLNQTPGYRGSENNVAPLTTIPE